VSDETVGTLSDDDDDDAPVRRSMPAIGARFGRYTITKLIGRGGMGAVYAANDPDLDRTVALKLIRDDRQHDTEGLRREAQALARLVHQNVVMVYDVGVAGDQVFLVMQLVDGVTLGEWIAKSRPTRDQILEKFVQAGHGLIGAHDVGLVHCDFKPGNVLVDKRGIARVTDFGLARGGGDAVAPIASLAPMIGMTTIAGTPAYMAPEQFEGLVTAASDQFAFCCALWECLAGERPYQDSAMPILDAGARGARKPMPRSANVPKHVMRALERGMLPDPSQRFASMAELLAALEPPRPWLHIAAIAAGGGLLVGGVVAYLAFARTPPAPWDAADLAAAHAMTKLGKTACAYSPAIEPGGVDVVFDRTQGEAVDLYAIPLAGGTPRPLTSAPTWEWRAQPGRRPGEVVYLVHDAESSDRSSVAYLDLATGASTPAVRGLAWDATVMGDALYYSPEANAGIRVLRGTTDREFVPSPRDRAFFLVSGSPRRDRIAVNAQDRNGGITMPCIVEMDGATTCLPTEITTRPVFSTDGTAVYLGTYDGIFRHDLATGAQVKISPASASGGIAVAPDGSALVYSNCESHEQLVELATGKVLVDNYPQDATMSSNGTLAWIQPSRSHYVLMVRTPDGRETQLTTTKLGNISLPKFSPDGQRIVFATGEPTPGLRLVEPAKAGQIVQLTSDALHKNPQLLADGRVAYTVSDPEGNDQAYIMSSDGSAQRRISAATRTVFGTDGKELLVAGIDAMYWLDPDTGAERSGPPRPPEAMLHKAALSPAATWIVFQSGTTGQRLYRARVAPPGPLELVHDYPAADLVKSPGIRDDGTLYASIGRWYGDLVKVPAKRGAKF